MPEEVTTASDVQDGAATSEETTAREDTQLGSAELTAEAIRQIIREEQQSVLDAQYRSYDRRDNDLKGQLAELRAAQRNADALLDAIARGTLATEEMSAIEATQEKAKLERQVRELEAERESNRLTSQDAPDPVRAALWDSILDDAATKAKAEGLTQAEYLALKPTQALASTGDPYGFKRAKVEWFQAMDALSDKKENAKTASVSVPNARAAGGSPAKAISLAAATAKLQRGEHLTDDEYAGLIKSQGAAT